VSARSLSVVIRSYLANDKPKLDRLLASYAGQPGIEAAVHAAALAMDERNRRHPHQRRLRREALLAAEAAFLRQLTTLSSITSFGDLFQQIEQSTHDIIGLGDLYSYDTALRLGAFLRLEPDAVYLHAGARKGAARLGVSTEERKVPPSAFPPELASLQPKDIENLLCIYKDHLI
jgi:hypothetical protein